MVQDNKSSKPFSAFLWSIAVLFLILFIPFWGAMSLAGIFAFGLVPLLDKIEKKFKGSEKRRDLMSAILVTVIAFVIVAPMSFSVYAIAHRVSEIASGQDPAASAQTVSKLKLFIANKIESLEYFSGMQMDRKVGQAVDTALTSGKAFTVNLAKTIVTQVPDFLVSIFIFFLGLFFFLSYSSQIKEVFQKQKFFKNEELDLIVHSVQNSSSQTLFSLIVVGAIQALIVAVGSLIAGYHDFMLIFVITLIVSFIPVIGAAPVALALALYSFSTGESGHGVVLLVVGVIAGSIDNILKPLLVSGDDVPGLLSLISLIGALVIFGFPGLFIGPVVGSLVFDLFKKRQANIVAIQRDEHRSQIRSQIQK